MELISKVSKGSRMDQIYLPKKRQGLPPGCYVSIRQLEGEPKPAAKPFFYGVADLEPIKIGIIQEIFKSIDDAENVIITGSFLDEGFRFNDIDVLVINKKDTNIRFIKETLESKIGANIHLINLTTEALAEGFSTDPLYMSMLSRCVSKKRIIFSPKTLINYKLLDLHLLKSGLLIDNFDILRGDEKYELVRNLIAINGFINKKKITKLRIDSTINGLFGKDTVIKLKHNMADKKSLLDKYKKVYNAVRASVLEGIENESKQKQID